MEAIGPRLRAGLVLVPLGACRHNPPKPAAGGSCRASGGACRLKQCSLRRGRRESSRPQPRCATRRRPHRRRATRRAAASGRFRRGSPKLEKVDGRVDGLFSFLHVSVTGTEDARAQHDDALGLCTGEHWAHYGRFLAVERNQRVQYTWVSPFTRGLA